MFPGFKRVKNHWSRQTSIVPSRWTHTLKVCSFVSSSKKSQTSQSKPVPKIPPTNHTLRTFRGSRARRIPAAKRSPTTARFLGIERSRAFPPLDPGRCRIARAVQRDARQRARSAQWKVSQRQALAACT